MRYAQIRKMDISNGEGIGISLFVQGCHFHCKNCFNSEAWDFNGGKEWTQEVRDRFIELAKSKFVDRVTILGGEPLEECNLAELKELIYNIRSVRPDIKIWIYSGYTFEVLAPEQLEVIKECDVLVDGLFDYQLRDLTLKFRGSSNQRIIDVKKTLQKCDIILHTC